MATRQILKNIIEVGARDWDRRLFDELIPLPNGTSYNSYLVIGSEKIALVETVDPTRSAELLANLNELKIKKLDYVIANHAEQDHSGSIPYVLERFPKAKVVTNAKCKEMLKDHLHIAEEKFHVVKDDETLSLGNKTLKFLITPWVHWPETQLTYLVEDKILFPCDFLGSHIASSELFADDEAIAYESAKRYYAEIMMPFRTSIKKHLERLSHYDIDFIAPSHGFVYRKPKFIIDAYKDWTSDKCKNEVLIPYVSMHGSTKIAVEKLTDELIKRNVTVKPFNLTKTDLGALAIALVDAACVVVAAPTLLSGPHPAALYATVIVGALRPKTKYTAIVSTYGWASKAADTTAALLGGLSAENLGVLSIKGLPKEEDLKAIEGLAEKIATKLKELS